MRYFIFQHCDVMPMLLLLLYKSHSTMIMRLLVHSSVGMRLARRTHEHFQLQNMAPRERTIPYKLQMGCLVESHDECVTSLAKGVPGSRTCSKKRLSTAQSISLSEEDTPPFLTIVRK